MNNETITGAEFARLCGISRAGIKKATDSGIIIRNEKKRYDLTLPENYDYLRKKQEKAEERGEPIPSPPPSKKEKEKKEGEKDQIPLFSDLPAPPPKMPSTPTPPAEGESRPELEREKIKKDLILKDIAIAKASGQVIARELIDPVWGKIYKSASYFGDFGQRYAGEWAAALGVTDPERIAQLEILVNEATELFMADFIQTVEAVIS